jgi:hypothetical protein
MTYKAKREIKRVRRMLRKYVIDLIVLMIKRRTLRGRR